MQPARLVEIGSTEAIKQIVASGVGISIVSTATVQDQLKLGRLKLVSIPDVRIERTLWQLKVPGRVCMPAAVAFERSIRGPIAAAARVALV